MAKKTIDEIVEEKHPTFANQIKEIKEKDKLDKALIVYLRQKEALVIEKARDEELIAYTAKKAELSKPYNQTINALKKMMNCIYKFGHKFEDELRTEFEKNLLLYAKQLAAVKAEKDADELLKAVTDAISDKNEDYNPTIKTLELKCEYISWYLKERFDDSAPKVEI